MIGWATINPVLLAVIGSVAVDQLEGVPEFRPRIDGRPAEAVSDAYQGEIIVRVRRVRGIHQDETRYVTGSDGEPHELRAGMRRVELELDARWYENEDTSWAFQTTERLRTRLGWESSRARLRAVGISLLPIGDAVNAGGMVDGRLLSRAILAISFLVAVNDEDPVPAGWFNKILLSSHLKEGDAELAPPLNFTNEQIPEDGP